MADIGATLMGLKLSSPVIVGASTFSRKTDNIKKAEDAGAGALTYFPHMEHASARIRARSVCAGNSQSVDMARGPGIDRPALLHGSFSSTVNTLCFLRA